MIIGVIAISVEAIPAAVYCTAISEKPDSELLEAARGLENVWLAGDFLTGPATVVEAVASARTALEDMKTKL